MRRAVVLLVVVAVSVVAAGNYSEHKGTSRYKTDVEKREARPFTYVFLLVTLGFVGDPQKGLPRTRHKWPPRSVPRRPSPTPPARQGTLVVARLTHMRRVGLVHDESGTVRQNDQDARRGGGLGRGQSKARVCRQGYGNKVRRGQDGVLVVGPARSVGPRLACTGRQATVPRVAPGESGRLSTADGRRGPVTAIGRRRRRPITSRRPTPVPGGGPVVGGAP